MGCDSQSYAGCARRGRRHRRLQAELLGFERHGDRAGAGHVDLAVAAHHFDEFVELLGIAGGFDGEAFGGGIDHAGVEDFGFLEHRGAAVLRAAHAHQHHFADHGGGFGQVGGLQHVDQLVHLLDDLGADAVFHIDHDGHAGELGVERLRDGQALNVVAARGEHAGDAQQRAGFVFEKNRDGLQHCS